MKRLAVEDFAKLLGTELSGFPPECAKLVRDLDFRYGELKGTELDAALLGMLKQLDAGSFNHAGKEKRNVWEKGWGENYRNFVKSGFDVKELIPKYYRPHQLARLRGKLVKSPNPGFDYDFFRVLRAWLARTYLAECRCVYEFGCGPGHNLVDLAGLFPEMRLFGFDWAKPSARILTSLREKLGYRVQGGVFDMFSPPRGMSVEKRSALITMGSLEQLGPNFGNFLEFALRGGFDIYINVEPIIEFYDDAVLMDYLAIRHHKMRIFLDGYFTRLTELEQRGDIRIEKAQRVGFGSAVEEGWSILVWRRSGKRRHAG